MNNPYVERVPPLRERWDTHPDRPCKDDDRYTHLEWTDEDEREDMKEACMSCPVYFECLEDLLSRPKWMFYGIQAGQEGLK